MRGAIRALLATTAVLLAACGDDGPRSVDHVVDIRHRGAGGPELVAIADARVWVAVNGVTPIQERLRKPGPPVRMRSSVEGIAAGSRGVWAALADGSVTRIDPERRQVRRSVRVGPETLGADRTPIAAGEGAVWVAVEDSLVPLHPESLKPRAPIRVGGVAQSIVTGDGSVWVAVGTGTRRGRRTSSLPPEPGTLLPPDRELVADDANSDRVLRIDARSGRIAVDVKVPGAGALALLGPELWASTDRGLESLDAWTLRPRGGGPVEVSAGRVTSLAAGPGGIWGTIGSQNLIVRLSEDRRELTDQRQIPSAAGPVSAEVGDVAVGEGSVWVGTSVGPRIGVIDVASGSG